MKQVILAAVLTAAWSCLSADSSHAQQLSGTLVATGSIGGEVKDPAGALIAGARVTAESTGLSRSTTTGRDGHFQIPGLAAGNYRVGVSAAGFSSAIVEHVSVIAGGQSDLKVSLPVAPASTTVEVFESAAGSASAFGLKPGAGLIASSRNAADLLAEAPGVSLRSNGEIASMPLLHGMGDERAKVLVDGMTVSNACPNHMNPALSYAAPGQAAQVTVMAGITPVSLGGDSIGGTIAVDSPLPVFASGSESLHEEGDGSGFYRSNGEEYGGWVNDWVAGRNFAIGYSGSVATNSDYTDGSGQKVTSTYSQTSDQKVTLAAQGKGNLFILQGSLHHTPYEGFVNAQMDLVRNYAYSLNLRWRRSLGRGTLDARIFWQNTFHSMNAGRDKLTFPMPMWMPMNTHGRDFGYTLRYDLPLSPAQTLRAGNELHRFVLDDIWPPVAGTAPFMGPNAFMNINHGYRLRIGTWAELASRWNPRWSTLLGVRNDTVASSAGPVSGYSNMYAADAVAFNAASRSHTDADFDLTALARYEPGHGAALEFGYARKNRAPNLYERYAWSKNWMAAGMIGWFGDGNYYVGNTALKPETANTVSGTVDLHGAGERPWEIKATPYLTWVENYTDVDTLDSTRYGMSNFALLEFANHSARIGGGDVSATATLRGSSDGEHSVLSATGAWVHGTRTDAKTPLYQMMPLTFRINLGEEWKGLSAGLGMEAVDRKSRLDPNRLEQTTPGYVLFNLHATYKLGTLTASAGAENLLNRWYELPLGGVNFDNFMAGMWMGQIAPLTGRGRSVHFSLSGRF
jgi:iron complex outermembrane receptor protein